MVQQRTILIVDDCPEDRELYRRYLQRDQDYVYTFVEAKLGQEGLKLYQQHQPDAILLDYRLPDLDGVEFLSSLQQQTQQLYVPVIVVTGQGSESIAVQTMKAGAQDYLVKGEITPKGLLRAIHEVIEKVQLRTELHRRIEREQLVTQITQQIHRSLDVDKILQTTVDGVRKLLNTNRVIIFQFSPDWKGTVVVESCGADWTAILSTEIYDPCFGKHYIEPFRQGLVTAKSDIYTAGISKCHLELLSNFQVRANLVVPIIQHDSLWGLLIAHHCVAPRQWQDSEIELLRQIAAQVSIALQQSALLQQAQAELHERKIAEAVLKEQQSILELFVRSAPAGIAMFDRSMRYVMASQRWVDEYHLDSVESLVGRSHYDIFSEIPERWRQIHQQYLAGAVEKCDDDLLVRADGTPQWVSWEIRPWYTTNGEIGGIIIFSVDVTHRKQTELALQQFNTELEQRVSERTAELTSVNERLSQSEEKFRQLAENIQDVFWVADIANQQILYVSPAYETLWGQRCESLYQNFGEWLNAIHPEDRPRVEQTLREKAPQGYFDHEYRVIHPNGSIRWIRDRAFPIKNEVGEIIRTAGIAEDITERQRVEEIKNEFISIVSHELRTPLMAIQMSLGLVKTGIYANKPEKAQRMIEIASIDTNRLVNLVNDILDLERLESGRTVLEKTVCQAYELMQQAVDGVQALASGQNITLVIAPTQASVWAAGDTIVQTLTNLLSNAIKFSDTDSVIHLGAEQQIDHVLFHVSDTGRGIPDDKLETIFGRFQQVDASDARSKGGTGLGLPICRSIIERHGGKIWAESTLGTGSKFLFTLPVPI